MTSPSVGGGGGGGRRSSSSSFSFHLLEVTVISAQDLHPTLPPMRPYAVVWVDPDEKLRTRIDTAGCTNPTWNDKFVFRVDDRFLRGDMAAVTVVVRASRWVGRDREVGTARLLLSSLRPAAGAQRCVALQVRRPGSLRPQGILNVGVALLDAAALSGLGNMVKMLCDDKAPSALAYRDIMRAQSFSSAATQEEQEEEKEEKEGEEEKNKAGRRTWELMVVQQQQHPQPQLERKKSVEEGRWAGEKEQEALESKLEQWRIDLSPERDTSDWSRSLRRKFRPFSCCSCARGGN